MKKSFQLIALSFSFLCVWGVLGSIGSTTSWAGTIQLTYSNFFPPTHIQSQLAEGWCQEVARRTEGRVKVQYFAGQTLTQANQTYDSVLDGIADIGFSAFAYTRGRFPVMGAIDLPMGYPDGVTATRVANSIYEQFLPKELENTQLMYIHAHGAGLIHTRGRAVRTLADLKGLKIRSTGISAQMVKALGGTPVPMPMPESYQSLQKGVVDGSANPIETNKGWKLGEVLDYVTLAYPVAYTTSFFVVMNKAKWSSIDPKDQAVIREINKEWAVKHGEAWDTSDKEGLQFFLDQGNTTVEIDPKEAARWQAAVAPMIDEYARSLDEKGLKGTDVIAAIRQDLKKK